MSEVTGNGLAGVNPQPGVLQYSRIRKSPYFYSSRKHGVQLYSVYNHTYHPRHYGDPFQEYWHLLNGVTLWDVGVERQIEISGPDAFDFTNFLIPRDLSKCKVEQCKYVFLTLPDGGIINDPVLLRLEENRFLLSLADSDVELWARGVAYNSNFNVEVKEVDIAPVQVQGPKSIDVMADLFGESIREVPYYYLRRYELDGMQVLVSRTGYTSELGYEIYLYDATKNGNADKLWARILEAGRPHGLEVIGPCHIRRIEGGILAFGSDMWFDTNPYEVGMGYDWMVDVDQEADFVGKDALRKVKAEGVSRKIVGLEIGGDKLGSYNDGSMIDVFPVRSDGQDVGKVTSACFSPQLDRNIGLAMVATSSTELGTHLEVETPSGVVPAVVVEKPFVDKEKAVPKQDLVAHTSGISSVAATEAGTQDPSLVAGS